MLPIFCQTDSIGLRTSVLKADTDADFADKKQKNERNLRKTDSGPICGEIDEGLEVWYNEFNFAQSQTNTVNFNLILDTRIIIKTENAK